MLRSIDVLSRSPTDGAELGLRLGRPNLEEFAATLLELAEQDRQIVVVTSDSRGSGKLGPFAESCRTDCRSRHRRAESGRHHRRVGRFRQKGLWRFARLLPDRPRAGADQERRLLFGRAGHPGRASVRASATARSAARIIRCTTWPRCGRFTISRIIVPADNRETRAAVVVAADAETPIYLRFGKAAMYDLPASPPTFEVGRAIRVREVTTSRLSPQAKPSSTACWRPVPWPRRGSVAVS